MSEPPDYFELIRQHASQRWDQLENDPDLAGPWHQLFKQVQSPRHVLSELLQNADDAGATEACVRVDHGAFIFTHNGEDFTKDHFASLCRFGYSNKRALHTIGFRGIGFKSTFSLGDIVELTTPTLSVRFDRQRFTEPKWAVAPLTHNGWTQIRVLIKDKHRQREVEKNLEEWVASPLSILFFKHIRRLEIGDQVVCWDNPGSGPVPNTEWMALNGDPDQKFLIARSPHEPFPPDALTEIRQERMVAAEQDVDFPPCRVEIVLGVKGRLYVVLPTGVETALPFACNAPFIQDPARLKIKDPETSPTNRWLLGRIGELAASVMLQWLNLSTASVAERAQAYSLFTDVERNDNSLDGICAATVEVAFATAIEGSAILLTDAGELKQAKQCVAIPKPLLDVWPAAQVAAFFDDNSRPALSRHVSDDDQEKFDHWGLIDTVQIDSVLTVLQQKHLPKPQTWRALLKLWSYIAPRASQYWYRYAVLDLCILPVQGTNLLHSSGEVVRLGERRLLQTEEDWNFLAAHIKTLDQNWTRFLADERREAGQTGKDHRQDDVGAAYSLLSALELEETSDVSTVIERMATEFFGQASIQIKACVRLAQIAAKLGATVGPAFRFVTRDGRLRGTHEVILFDAHGDLDQFFSEEWCREHLLHPDYTRVFASCTRDEWRKWIASERAKLCLFAPISDWNKRFWGRSTIETELSRRGCCYPLEYKYKRDDFMIHDWDFDEVIWQHWVELAKTDQNIYGRIMRCIASQPVTYWKQATDPRCFHVATSGHLHQITQYSFRPSWIMRFRDLPCLPDTNGTYRKPADLLRRTPATEPFLDVEPFIDGSLDKEALTPLFILLGVGDKPTRPDRLLNILRAFAKSDAPPVLEVDRWYRRLDQMVNTCTTADFISIKTALGTEKLILTEGAGWASLSGVFLTSNEDDVPGAAVVRAAVRDLTLWRKIGVNERPTADLAIEWLTGLTAGKALAPEDARRVRALLPRHAQRIWSECQHWPNLAGEWAPIDTLRYAINMQTLVPWSHLHEWVKQITADFRPLLAETSASSPFAGVPALASQVEDRLQSYGGGAAYPERVPWLRQLGTELLRFDLVDATERERVRALAARLATTEWQTVQELEVISYIDGVPAGTSRQEEVVWLDRTLYVKGSSRARLARLIPEYLGRLFGRAEITAALNYCYGRSVTEVSEYLEENFALAARATTAFPDSAVAEPAPLADQSPIIDPTPDTPRHSPDVTANEGTIDQGAPADVIEDPEVDNVAIDLASISPGVLEQASEGHDTVTHIAQRERPVWQPARPGIMERLALMLGFRKDSNERFYHTDGSSIARSSDDRALWEHLNATGDLICYYWPKDHCLESEPLQLDAAIWGLIDKFPHRYSLVLADRDDNPLEIPGSHLRAMRERGGLRLYPATYRLVYEHEKPLRDLITAEPANPA